MFITTGPQPCMSLRPLQPEGERSPRPRPDDENVGRNGRVSPSFGPAAVGVSPPASPRERHTEASDGAEEEKKPSPKPVERVISAEMKARYIYKRSSSSFNSSKAQGLPLDPTQLGMLLTKRNSGASDTVSQLDKFKVLFQASRKVDTLNP